MPSSSRDHFTVPDFCGSDRARLEAWIPRLRAWKAEYADEPATLAMLERRERWALGRLAELALRDAQSAVERSRVPLREWP